MKGGNESDDHYRLKRAALVWLHDRGARTIAFEVPVRTPEYAHMRIDVAAWDAHRIIERTRGPRGGKRRRRVGAVDELIAIECKATRADYLKDARRLDELGAELGRLDATRARLEARIRETEPHLRSRRDLFSDESIWHYERSSSDEYRGLLARTHRISRHLHAGTKFEQLRRAGMFHRHYVCAAAGVLSATELPPGWGLLEADAANDAVRLQREAPPFEVDDHLRPEVVRRLARAGTRALLFATGLTDADGGLQSREAHAEGVQDGWDSRPEERLGEEPLGEEPSDTIEAADGSPKDEEKAVGTRVASRPL